MEKIKEIMLAASMAALPMALGCLAGGYGMEKLGRRRMNQLLCLPFIAGWLLMTMAHNVQLLIAGRFLTGIIRGNHLALQNLALFFHHCYHFIFNILCWFLGNIVSYWVFDNFFFIFVITIMLVICLCRYFMGSNSPLKVCVPSF
jgi:MFS family permease